MRAREFTQEGVRDIVNWGRNVVNRSDPDAPIVMMTNPRNIGARTASGQRMRIQDFPLKTVPVHQLRPWEPMTKMRDLPSQRTDDIVEYSMFDLHHELYESIANLDTRLFENHETYSRLKDMLKTFATPNPRVGKEYVYTSIAATPIAKFINVAQFDQPRKLIDIKNDRYYFLIDDQIRAFPEQGSIDQRDSYQHIFMFDNTTQRDQLISWILMNYSSNDAWQITHKKLSENFADGRKPGRKGLSKRMGVPTGASVTRLRQIAKSSSGEKQRMAHWMANMKSGRKKNK